MASYQEEKQKYLREHIAANKYESFVEYCLDKAGNVDLEAWQWDYLRNLVKSFNTDCTENNNALNQSFVDYQQNNDQEIRRKFVEHESVKEDTSRNNKANNQNKTAMSLLDSVVPNQPSRVRSTPSDLPSIDLVSSKEMQFRTLDPDLFAKGEFWTNSPKKGKTTADPSLPKNRDQLDFWHLFDSDQQRKSKTVANFQFDKLNKFTSLKNQSSALHRKDSKQRAQSGPHLKQAEKKKPQLNQPIDNIAVQIPSSTSHQNKGSPFLKKEGQKSGQGPSKPAIKLIQIKQQPFQIRQSKCDSLSADGKKGEFWQDVKCITANKRNKLEHENLQIFIRKYLIIQRNFLMSDYAMFELEIMPLGLVVKRNHEDFLRLKDLLSRQYPARLLPYLEKQSWFSDTSVEYVQRQKIMLTFFVNDLVMDKQLRNSRMLQQFLTLPEHKHIKRKLEEYEQLMCPKAIEQLCLLDGKIEVRLGEKVRQHHQYFKKYHEKMMSYLGQFSKLTENLKELLDQLKATLLSLSQICSLMSDETRKFNLFSHGYEIKGLEETALILRNICDQRQQQLKSEIDLVTQKILPLLKYQRSNFESILSLAENQAEFQRLYSRKAEQGQTDTVKSYFDSSAIEHKNGVLEPSRSIVVLKYQTGFLSSQLCKQSQRLGKNISRRLLTLIEQYSLKQAENSLKNTEFWRAITRNTSQ